MCHSARTLPALVCAALVVFCPAAAIAQDADARAIAGYRLTLDGLTKVMNANRTVVRHLMEDPKSKELLEIRREIAALEKKDDLTDAESERLDSLRERAEAIEESNEHPLGGETRTLAEMEERIRAYPPLMKALQAENMSPREYSLFWMAFLQATIVQKFQKAGMMKQLPPDVNPDNVKFVTDHVAEIEAMQKEIEALSKGR